MNASKCFILLKSSIIILGLCGLITCLLWYPFSISLSTMGVVEATPTLEQNIQMWTQLLFYWLASIPCFIVLAIAWKISNEMKREKTFRYKVAKLIKICAIILSVDLAMFLIGNMVFLRLNWNDFALIYFIIAAIGTVVVNILFIWSNFVIKAANLQEELEESL